MVKEQEEEKKCLRTANFEVYLKDDKDFSKRNAIREDIWTFRRACGSVAGLLYMLEFAIAKREMSQSHNMKLLPAPAGVDNEVLKQLLAATAGFDKKSAIYELAKRCFDAPATPVDAKKKGIPIPWTTAPWLAEIASSVQRVVEKRWTSKDAFIPKCRRNWLALNYDRKFPMFKFQGLPLRAALVNCRDYEIELTWRKDLPIVFKLGELDPVRRSLWHKIKKDGWNTCVLNERDGQLRISVCYEVERTIEKLETKRVLEVSTGDNPDKFFALRIVEGHKTLVDDLFVEYKNVSAIVAWLNKLSVQQDKLKAELTGCGLNNRVFKAIQERRDNVTKVRDNGVKNWNHVWSKAIVREALRRNCGQVRVHVPSSLFKREWQWSDLEFKLKYKTDQLGIGLEVVREKSAEK
jgi:hypothetical protein